MTDRTCPDSDSTPHATMPHPLDELLPRPPRDAIERDAAAHHFLSRGYGEPYRCAAYDHETWPERVRCTRNADHEGDHVHATQTIDGITPGIVVARWPLTPTGELTPRGEHGRAGLCDAMDPTGSASCDLPKGHAGHHECVPPHGGQCAWDYDTTEPARNERDTGAPPPATGAVASPAETAATQQPPRNRKEAWSAARKMLEEQPAMLRMLHTWCDPKTENRLADYRAHAKALVAEGFSANVVEAIASVPAWLDRKAGTAGYSRPEVLRAHALDLLADEIADLAIADEIAKDEPDATPTADIEDDDDAAREASAQSLARELFASEMTGNGAHIGKIVKCSTSAGIAHAHVIARACLLAARAFVAECSVDADLPDDPPSDPEHP